MSKTPAPPSTGIREGPCRDSSELLRPYLDGELPDVDRGIFEEHVRNCATCRAALERRRLLKEVIRSTYDGRRISGDFARKASDRLTEMADQPRKLVLTLPDAGEIEGAAEGDDGDADPIGFGGEGRSPRASGKPSFAGWIVHQTPWWGISIILHVLLITFIGLVTWTIKDLSQDDVIVVVTTLEARKDFRAAPELAPKPGARAAPDARREVPATDPTSNEVSDIVVPADILAKAELGDHFETINLDRPDTHSAFGNPDAKVFHSAHGDDGAAGGGGTGGVNLDSLIGVGLSGSPGTGGGWGGGHGTGIGPGDGPGRGSFAHRRDGGGRKLMVMKHCGSMATESAVDKALAWLARHQEADGRWDTVKHGGKKADVAVTGFALLAFLGAGHSEKAGKYRENVQRAVYWLKSIQQADGRYYIEGDGHGVGYSHAIAGLAMCEAAGMARDPDTVKSAQRGVEFTTEGHQDGDEYEKKGWRYTPKSRSMDISHIGWFVMQIKSAKVAGLKVNPASFQGAIKSLDALEVKGNANDPYGGHRYFYEPGMNAANVSFQRTAIGVLCRQFLGWRKEELQGAVEWFVEEGKVPKHEKWGGVDHLNLYYYYYGTLCAFQQGGDIWKRWNEALKTVLPEAQRKGGDEDGSWDPAGPYAPWWGRVGETATACLCLEVYYRYLPLYK